MTNEKDPSYFSRFNITHLGMDIQQRMVKDVQALIVKGMSEEQAVDWVYARRQNYLDNPQYSLAPFDGFPLEG